ncbi:MAG TPA: hypothetical protein VHF89_02415 [Solirubrobacteraceae bacterium]|nr:hypothetical protein [Solirubrobacteraceae bacterium]
MGELGELLELLHRGGTGDRTVRATVRAWSDPELAAEAFRAAAEEEGAAVFAIGVAAGAGGDDEPPAAASSTVRLWIAPPDRVREEAEGGPEGRRLGVRRGRRWWLYDERSGAMSNEDDEEVGSGVGEEHGVLFEPARLLGALVLEPEGWDDVAGRRARLALARPRPARHDEASWVLDDIGAGADEWSLAVDEEHGVLLRVEARRGGRPFHRLEVLELAVGEPIPDEVFEFEPPPGEQVRTMRDEWRVQRDLRLDELARLAPFAVFVPDRLRPGWRLDASFVDANERAGVPAAAHLRLHTDDGHWHVAIEEVAAAAPEHPFDSLDVPGAWQTVTRDGREIALRAPSERWARALARVEIEGTRVTLSSDDVEADRLGDLAARLVRAPDAPPAL